MSSRGVPSGEFDTNMPLRLVLHVYHILGYEDKKGGIPNNRPRNLFIILYKKKEKCSPNWAWEIISCCVR